MPVFLKLKKNKNGDVVENFKFTHFDPDLVNDLTEFFHIVYEDGTV